MKIDIIAGARPNFMKIAPIVAEIDRRRLDGAALHYRLIHTGQHYDSSMSDVFFSELGIPDPEINLEVGSGPQSVQTGAIMSGYERVLCDSRSDLCMVVGDVNSTMACSIVARKAGISVAHVEAGIRSGDWSMPEEINRVVTDSIANWFYTTSRLASDNLLAIGVDEDAISFVGNTMIDTLLANQSKFRKPECWKKFGLAKSEFIVMTMHRPANVDDAADLSDKILSIAAAADGMPIVFPVHPRTAAVLVNHGPVIENLLLVDPMGYLEFNYLVSHACGVITDSGGITEETTVLGIPCMTLRDNTERPETVTFGTNELVGTATESVLPWVPKLVRGEWKSGEIPERWDGQAAVRIVDHLCALAE